MQALARGSNVNNWLLWIKEQIGKSSNCNTGWVSSSRGVPGVGASFGTVAAGGPDIWFGMCVATIFGVG